MKNNILKYAAIIFALTVIGFSSCKKINADSIAVNITAIYTSPTTVQFQNANPTSPNLVPGGDYGFSVTISGPDSSYVVASDGSRVFKVSHGILGLALTADAHPSASRPYVFNISGTTPGFAPMTQTVTIADTGITSVVIKAIEYAHTVDGTSILLQSTGVNNGVSSGSKFTTTPTGSLTEAASITIAPGTEVRDINGKIIKTDTIRTYAIQYGTGTEASLSAFPGGFNAPNILDANKQPIQGGGTFVTAGLMQINMEATDGTPIKNFSKPVQLEMEINSNLENPTTGVNMKEGDTIPIWSLNESTGQWQYENTVTIKTNSNGKLYASFGITHLSTWNMDFLYHYDILKSPSKMTVKFHLPQGTSLDNCQPELQYASNSQYISAIWNANLSDGYTTTMQPVPNIPRTKLVVYDNQYNKVNATVVPSVFNPATVGTVDVTVTPPPVPDYVNLKMNIWGHCSNKNTNINVGTYVYFYPTSGNIWNDYHYCYIATNGWSWNNPVRLKTGVEYNVATWYGGSWNSNKITITKQNFSFPTVSLDGVVITGNGVYTPSNNTLTVNCTFQVRCN